MINELRLNTKRDEGSTGDGKENLMKGIGKKLLLLLGELLQNAWGRLFLIEESERPYSCARLVFSI